MKTQEWIEWNGTPRPTRSGDGFQNEHQGRKALPGPARVAGRVAGRVAQYLLATALGAGLILLSVLGLELPSMVSIVQASTLLAGYVLLAAAVDDDSGLAGYLFISGTAVLVLALLSRLVAVELVIIAETILSMWLVFWVTQIGK